MFRTSTILCVSLILLTACTQPGTPAPPHAKASPPHAEVSPSPATSIAEAGPAASPAADDEVRKPKTREAEENASSQSSPKASPGDDLGEFDAEVTGVVRNAAGDPISGICVDLLADNEGHAVLIEAVATTDVRGRYKVREDEELPDWRIRFRDCRADPVFAFEWFDDVKEASEARRLGPGRHVADATLGPGVTLGGKITDEDGAPIENVCIHVHDGTRLHKGEDEPWYAFAPFPVETSGTDGTFTVQGLAPGDYQVRFHTGSPSETGCTEMRYKGEWFDDHDAGDHGKRGVTDELPDSDVITLSRGQVRDDINAILQECTEEAPC